MTTQQNNSENSSQNTSKKASSTTPMYKRVLAIIGIILILSMYLITLVMAFIDKSTGAHWFMASLIVTMAVPFLIWVFIWIYGVVTDHHTIASFDLNRKNQEKESE